MQDLPKPWRPPWRHSVVPIALARGGQAPQQLPPRLCRARGALLVWLQRAVPAWLWDIGPDRERPYCVPPVVRAGSVDVSFLLSLIAVNLTTMVRADVVTSACAPHAQE